MKNSFLPILLGALALTFLLLYLFDKPQIETVTTIDRDTTWVTDTLWLKTPPREVPIPVPFPVVDTLYLPSDTVLVNRYTRAFEDSLLDGELTATVQGVLVDWGFRYSLTIPVVKDSVIIETKIHTKQILREWSLNLGVASVFGVGEFYIGPKAQFKTRGDKTFGFGMFPATKPVYFVDITLPLVRR